MCIRDRNVSKETLLGNNGKISTFLNLWSTDYKYRGLAAVEKECHLKTRMDTDEGTEPLLVAKEILLVEQIGRGGLRWFGHKLRISECRWKR